MNNKFNMFFVFMAGILGGCNGNGDDNYHILLEIGSYQLTVADYEFVSNSERYKMLTHEQLQDKLVEEGQILAFALDNRYDTLEGLKRQLDYAMYYYASKVDGYVWNKMVKPFLQVTEKDIRQAYDKSVHEYHGSVPLRSYEQERPVIRESLLNALKEKYIRESQQQVLLETQPVIYEPAIADMTAKVNARERQWPGVDQNAVLMEYDFKGTHRVYTMADFIEFVHCQPVFFGSLSNAGDVKKMLHAYLINICLFAKAQQMNMESDPAYQLFRKRYQHYIFLYHYNQHAGHPAMTIAPKYPIKVNHIKAYQEKGKNREVF